MRGLRTPSVETILNLNSHPNLSRRPIEEKMRMRGLRDAFQWRHHQSSHPQSAIRLIKASRHSGVAVESRARGLFASLLRTSASIERGCGAVGRELDGFCPS